MGRILDLQGEREARNITKAMQEALATVATTTPDARIHIFVGETGIDMPTGEAVDVEDSDEQVLIYIDRVTGGWEIL